MRQLFNLKSYFTFLSRNKMHTAINVFGLGISFAFAVLIGLYYQHETGIDKSITSVDRLYLLGRDFNSDKTSGTSRRIIRVLQKQLPQIEKGCAFHINREQHVTTAGENNVKVTMIYTDSALYSMFSQPLAEDDTVTVLNGLTDMVIFRKLAQMLFHNGNAMSKVLAVENRKVYVGGVYENMSGTSFPNYDIIGRYELPRERIPWLFKIDGNLGSPDVVLGLRPGADISALENNVNRILPKIHEENFKIECKFRLIPFNENRSSGCFSNICQRERGDLVYLILIIGIIVLVFSVMDYINLTVTLLDNRSKEVAAGRLLGNRKNDILWRLAIESMCLCCCSVVLSMLLAWASIPYTCQLLDTHITITELFSPINLLLLVGIALAVDMLVGVLPAVIQSRVEPIDVVRGTFRRQTKILFNKVLIMVQSAVTIIFVAVTLTGNRQIRHLIDAPLGYDTRGVMEVGVPQDAHKANLFKKNLQQLTPIEKISVCLCSPLLDGFNQMAYIGEKAVRYQRFYADKDYLPLLNIEVKKQFTQSDSAKLFVSPNFHSVVQLKPGEKTFRYNGTYGREQVNDILNDFHLYTIDVDNADNQVTVVYLFDQITHDDFANNVLIKMESNEQGTYRLVQETYEKVYHGDLAQESPYLNQRIAEVYKEQARIVHVLTIFSFLAVLISLLGLVVMFTYFIQQHSKEIATRKVFGSISNRICHDLIRTFLQYVSIAFITGISAIWCFTGGWISQYSYRIVWWPWIVVAGILVLLISFCAVAVQNYMVSNENSVKDTKQE